MEFALDTTVTRAPGLMSTEIDDELVILSMSSNNYVTLDSVGRRIWELLAEPITVGALIRELEGSFNAPDGQIRADVLAFLQDISSDNLIKTHS